VDLFYTQYSGGGTLYWKVDGGTATNVNTNGATNNTMKIQIRGLSAGSHTIEIGWVSGTVFASGAMVYNGDESKGIRSWVAAFPSTKSSAWWNPAVNYWLGQMTNVQPDLVTIELGPNDYGQNPPLAVASYKSNVQNIIATIKTNTGYVPSFVLLPVWPLVPAGTQPETWQQYVDAMYEIAAADTDGAVCVCDWMNRTSNVPNTTISGILDPDKTHPSPLGNRYLGEQLATFVAPR
jgi:lysophospholipase L1-like esterase